MTRKAFDPRRRGTSAWVTAIRERTFGSATEKLMLMVMSDYINADDVCWPGVDTLAAEVGVNPKTIKRALERLESIGVVLRVPRPNTKAGGGKRTDAIKLCWEGFLVLPVVEYPKPLGANDDEVELRDILSAELGDPDRGSHGHREGVVRGHSGGAPSFRTPSLEPPQEPLAATGGTGLALVPPLPSQATGESWRLCTLLADLIEANGSKRPTITARWLQEADRLARIDGRSPEQIERAIRWCQADGFWCGNVLSMPTLRKQYDRLRLAAKHEAAVREGRAQPAKMNRVDQRVTELMAWAREVDGR